MPISKRINNLHIRSRSALLNSDDEGQEENGVEHSTTDSSCSCQEQELGFLVDSNGTFHGTGLEAAGATPVMDAQPTVMCSTSLTVPVNYQNGHQHHHQQQQVFNGEMPNTNHCESYQLPGLGPQIPTWDAVNGMLQELNSYEPDLDERQNPYYYHANEMLYHLHIARLQRISRLHGHPHMG